MVKSTLATLCLLLLLITNSVIFAAQTIPHDPTQPVSVASFEQTDDDNIYGLKIDAIIITKTNKIAIINGQRLQIGDKISGLNVADIYPHAVKLKDGNEEIMIKIPYSEIKQQINNTQSKQINRIK